MGDWKIVIEGIGAHHNQGYKNDANEVGKGLVQILKDAGQNVTAAHFEYGNGQQDDLLIPVQTSAPVPQEPAT